jgi:hypothetical protein
VWDPDQKKFVTGEIKVHIPCGHWHTPQGSGGGGGGNGDEKIYQAYVTSDNSGTVSIYDTAFTSLLYTYTIPDYAGKVIVGFEIDDDGFVYTGSRSSPYQIISLSPILAYIDKYESPGLCEDDTELQKVNDLVVDTTRMRLYAGGQTCFSGQPALQIFSLDVNRNITEVKILVLEATGGEIFAMCQDNTYIYCGTADASGKIYRVNKDTEVITTWTILAGMLFDESAFEMNEGLLYAGGYTSLPNLVRLYKIDPSDGSILASYVHGVNSYTKGIFFRGTYVYLTSYAFNTDIIVLNMSDLTLSNSGGSPTDNAAFAYDPDNLIGYYADYGFHKYSITPFDLDTLVTLSVITIAIDYINNIVFKEKTWT